jgi:hypothetical protein
MYGAKKIPENVDHLTASFEDQSYTAFLSGCDNRPDPKQRQLQKCYFVPAKSGEEIVMNYSLHQPRDGPGNNTNFLERRVLTS